jgi:hypothetical protein
VIASFTRDDVAARDAGGEPAPLIERLHRIAAAMQDRYRNPGAGQGSRFTSIPSAT